LRQTIVVMKRVRHEDLAREFLSQGWSPAPVTPEYIRVTKI